MAVNVKYQGGPLHGRKGTLKQTDTAPDRIKADAQAKAANMQAGQYEWVGSYDSEDGEVHHYGWRS